MPSSNGQTSDWFKVRTGVKQGCVKSGFLFLLAIDWVMRQTTDQCNTGIRWRLMEKLEDLDFADDIVLASTTINQMQRKTTKLADTASKIGLRISRKKTEALKVNCRGKERIKFPDGEEIKEVKVFVYLGAIVSNEGGADKDMSNRLAKAKVSFGKLRKIWSSKQYSRKVKIRLYETLVKPVPLYRCETWKINVADNERLDSFQFKCL